MQRIQRLLSCAFMALAMGGLHAQTPKTGDAAVADEAVSALEVSVQQQVLTLLRDVRNCLGLSMLFVTHDLRVASQICDRIAVMNKGRIVETGTVQAIANNPQHPYTRSLFEVMPGQAWERRARQSEVV